MPPLVTDIDLSMDDRFLYVACWGTGEMREYDVTEPGRSEARGLRPCGRDRLRHCSPPEWQGVYGRPRRWSKSAAMAGGSTPDRLALFHLGQQKFPPDGVPGAEVMAIAHPAGGLELAKDYWSR